MDAHQRDGSLLRKKQDQWAKERAENSENCWFPFGTPGGGTPNRKYESLIYAIDPAKTGQKASISKSTSTTCDSNDITMTKLTHQTQPEGHADMINEEDKHYKEQANYAHLQTSPTQQHPQLYSRPNTCAISVPAGSFSNASGSVAIPWSYLHPIPINFVPPGTIPIPIQNTDDSTAVRSPVCQFTLADQFGQMNSNNVCWAPMVSKPVPMAIPIPTPVPIHSAPLDPSQERITVASLQEPGHGASTSVTSPQHSGKLSKFEGDRRTFTINYEEQIAEKKRIEAENAERERCEDEKIMRERDDRIRREAEKQQRLMEEERLREQERERIRKSMEEALIRAKHEAEVTRKARVFKHVIEGAEKSPELERRLLGVDSETGDRILHEITQLERHKKLDRETIDKHSPKTTGDAHDKSACNHRSKGTQQILRHLSLSEPETAPKMRNDKEKKTLTKEHITHIQPSKSSNDNATRHTNGVPEVRPTSSLNVSTPFRRNIPGRMSMRVTRKEKENAATDEFSRISVGTVNGSYDSIHAQDHRIPPSKIPVAASLHNAPICGGRSSSQSFCEPTSASHYRLTTTNLGGSKFTKDLVENPLFNPVSTRHRRPNKMRGITDSPVSLDSAESSGGGTTESSSGCNSSSESTSPQTVKSATVPAIVNYDPIAVTKFIPTLNNNELKIRSALVSSVAYLNQTPLSTSRFAKKLAEKGCAKQIEDNLAPEARRRAEANLSRTSSVQSLRGSIGNLAGWRGSVSNLAEDSPYLSRFKSMNPKYRSFNTKSTTEKQKEVIDRLCHLRESLRSRENFGMHSPILGHQIDINTGIPSSQNVIKT